MQADTPVRWAEIDAGALAHNTRLIRSRIEPTTQLMAMVKSNGYGHGSEIAARASLGGGATWLGVYTPDEALALRATGLDVPTLVVGWSPPATHATLIERDIDVTVVDVAGIESVAREAGRLRRKARVHVKIDTGLGRLGVRAGDLNPVVAALGSAGDQVTVVGMFTHFADAESNPDFTLLQHQRFLEAVDALRPVAPDALLHTSGSAAIIEFPELHHDLVRLGISLYGYLPHGIESDLELRPAMSVFAQVAQVKTVDTGETLGYGRTWRADERRRVATVAIGYGQGVRRALSNHGHMVVNGRRCPIAGIVSMDQVTLDVTDVGDVATGDTAMFFGEWDGVRLGADEVAEQTGTIAYEVLCGVAASVPRVAVRRSIESGTVGP